MPGIRDFSYRSLCARANLGEAAVLQPERAFWKHHDLQRCSRTTGFQWIICITYDYVRVQMDSIHNAWEQTGKHPLARTCRRKFVILIIIFNIMAGGVFKAFNCLYVHIFFLVFLE